MRIGLYELLEVVGKGGMGSVYRARHRESGETVAVKVMAAELASDPILLKRFTQEYTAASRLRHPHIVRGLDFGVQDGQPYLVMEFVDGQSLGNRIREQGPLSEEEAVRLTLQIADALELAHREKLIHRDVKPDNILLTRDGQAKLADLGLIKDLDAAVLTRPRACLGTITFMAPEQFGEAQSADARCDVYGLAATLYYLLTGVAPFQGRGNLTILEKKLHNDFLPPRQIVPLLRKSISQAICRALEAEPERRLASCRELAELLSKADPAEETETEDASMEDAAERRGAFRYPTALGAFCRISQHGELPCPAEVQDLSLTGICLQLERRLEPGTAIGVDLREERLGTGVSLTARIRWVRQVAAGRWSVGCAFSRELSEGELSTLLGNCPPTAIIQAGV